MSPAIAWEFALDLAAGCLRSSGANVVGENSQVHYDGRVSPSVPSPENTRENERVKVDAFVKVNGGNDREYVFRTRDLSEGGLFLYTKVTHIYPIKVGSRLTLELYDFDEYISCTVVVMRVVEPDSSESAEFPTGFGVKIHDIDEQNQQRLAAMLSRLGEGVALY